MSNTCPLSDAARICFPSRRRGIAEALLAWSLISISATAGDDPWKYEALPMGWAWESGGRTAYAKVIEGPDGALWGTTRYGGAPSEGGVVFKVGKDGRNFRVVHYFGVVTNDGLNPTYGALTIGTNNWIYGTANYGGPKGQGTIFRIHPGTLEYQGLFDFDYATGSGYYPRCKLIIGEDGLLYGTTQSGTVFGIRHDGSEFQAISQATPNNDRGGLYQAGVIQGSDGWLYGTSEDGGLVNPARSFDDWPTMGLVYRVRPDGSTYEVLHRFEGVPVNDGFAPRCALLEASDGKLYGTTTRGGIADSFGGSYGTIFRMERDGAGYEVLHRFYSSGEVFPYCDLVESPDGILYGQPGSGGVFKIAKDGSGYAVIASTGGAYSGVTLASDGRLYGANFTGVFVVGQDGSGFQWLHKFGFFGSESTPRAPLLRASTGFIFGTTEAGGGPNSNGTIFVVVDAKSFPRVLQSDWPPAFPAKLLNGLAEGTNGFLYGTSQLGGSNNAGVIFRLSPEGQGLTNLYHFGSAGDGKFPRAALVSGGDGYLYGAGYQGGTFNRGTIFRIAEDGTAYAILRHLGATMPDGQAIQAALILGPGGILFGVENGGGSANRGTVFRLERNGSGYSILRNFAGGTDGANPQTSLLTASDGLLYGTTTSGGEGFGTLYRLRPDGSDYQVTHRLRAAATDGNQPRGPLVEQPPGVLWGCTVLGGTNNAGVIFRARTDGSDYRVIHHFGTGTNDGKMPGGGLTLEMTGWLTGTTPAGGAAGVGTLFRFDPTALILKIESVGLNAVVTWEGGVHNETDRVETAVGWSEGQPVWESFGADIEVDGFTRRSVLPLPAVNQLLFRVRRDP